jgi:hypothetical protein
VVGEKGKAKIIRVEHGGLLWIGLPLWWVSLWVTALIEGKCGFVAGRTTAPKECKLGSLGEITICEHMTCSASQAYLLKGTVCPIPQLKGGRIQRHRQNRIRVYFYFYHSNLGSLVDIMLCDGVGIFDYIRHYFGYVHDDSLSIL